MTFLWIILGVLGAALCLFLFGWINAIRASVARDGTLDQLIEPALAAIREESPLAKIRVMELADNPATRNHLYTVLVKMGKADLFPTEYRSVEKMAESDLARWLMHPNELGSAPSNMELMERIAIEEQAKNGSMFLFRFRTNPSHWAWERGWMAGVAGPYWDGAPQVFGTSTFSELTPFHYMTVEQHVEHLKAALRTKGLVVRS